MGRQTSADFERLLPVTDRYATQHVRDAFTWDDVLDSVDQGEWYMVAFRSVHRADADEARLTAYDDWAHDEAMRASGFVHYFKGPTCPDGSCMSFCLWDSRAEARAAAGQARHAEAAAIVHEMYARYELEFHRVRRTEAGFTFEDYDSPGARPEHPTLPAFQPGLSPS